jgi:hypothetical protein
MAVTTKEFPRALIGKELREKTHYKKTGKTNLIAGKHLVMTSSGFAYLYMGDDPRKTPPIQIIVSTFDGSLAYLPIERKEGFELVMEDNSI